MDADDTLPPATNTGRRVLFAQANALQTVGEQLGDSFEEAARRLFFSTGRIVITGVGKSADVAQKLVGTFNSTGTRAYLLDATRAVHGDLGMVDAKDTALVLSHSGRSEEILRLLPPLKSLCRDLIALTGNAAGPLALRADTALIYGDLTESCPLKLAPSTSTTVMMALGDALAFTLMEWRGFDADDFARYHPAGALGRKLTTVEAILRHGHDLRLARPEQTVRAVLAQRPIAGRRSGAVLITDEVNHLLGIFTDSDLARLFESRHDAALDRPIGEVMTARPIALVLPAKLTEAHDLMRARKISELPVVNDSGMLIGLIDITDLLALETLGEAGNVGLLKSA